AGLLSVRDGPFGEMIDLMESPAFAYCDHQVAHLYVPDSHHRAKVAALFEGKPGVAEVLDETSKQSHGLHHPNSGELVLLAEPDSWFSYHYWLEDRRAPDFARTVDIHRKPGYDPLELFFDPAIGNPKLRVGRKVIAKKLGFRALVDVTPLDNSLVRGSPGVAPQSAEEGPLLLSPNPALAPRGASMTDVAPLAMQALGFSEVL
ncbi:MAG: alkaline phosphatase family protein, partial [Planctomycetes bacterium]|nr:alkaline phosphatase family protein [Planctomycetota bacterium]